jgi:hypothetical protein
MYQIEKGVEIPQRGGGTGLGVISETLAALDIGDSVLFSLSEKVMVRNLLGPVTKRTGYRFIRRTVPGVGLRVWRIS